MKKLKIGLFSLFALTAGGTAVISAIPQSAIAAPLRLSPLKWLINVVDKIKDTLIALDTLWDTIVGNKPGQNVQQVTVDMNTLLANPDMIAAYAAEGLSLSRTMFSTEKDVVVINDRQHVAVLKAGRYAINQSGKAVLKIDIFLPSPTFPQPPGTLLP